MAPRNLKSGWEQGVAAISEFPRIWSTAFAQHELSVGDYVEGPFPQLRQIVRTGFFTQGIPAHRYDPDRRETLGLLMLRFNHRDQWRQIAHLILIQVERSPCGQGSERTQVRHAILFDAQDLK